MDENENDVWVINFTDVSKNIHKLDADFLEFLKTDEHKSFLGWLLTLNIDEFKILHEYANDETGESHTLILPLILHFGKLPMDGDTITEEEFQDAGNKIINYVSLISLYKKGYIDITKRGIDDEWAFKPTGKDFYQQII